MNSENVVKHLRALWRTDRIIAEIRMRHMLVGLGLRAFAALIAAFGLLMLELSAYFALVQIWSAISAAAILGAVNFGIAAILFLIAGRPPRGRELELATEIHDSAMEALQLEARALQSQVSGAIHNPLNGILPLLIVPLITIIIKSLKKPAAKAAAASPARGNRTAMIANARCPRASSLTSQTSCSTGSVFTWKPRCRHISSITVFSLNTSPEMAFSPSDFAYSMISCIKAQPSPLPLRSDLSRMAYSPLS